MRYGLDARSILEVMKEERDPVCGVAGGERPGWVVCEKGRCETEVGREYVLYAVQIVSKRLISTAISIALLSIPTNHYLVSHFTLLP